MRVFIFSFSFLFFFPFTWDYWRAFDSFYQFHIQKISFVGKHIDQSFSKNKERNHTICFTLLTLETKNLSLILSLIYHKLYLQNKLISRQRFWHFNKVNQKGKIIRKKRRRIRKKTEDNLIPRFILPRDCSACHNLERQDLTWRQIIHSDFLVYMLL